MTWTTIPNSQVDVGSPASASLMQALRDNFAGMANGDPGAPQITAAALATASVTNDAIALGTIGANRLQSGSPEVAWVLDRMASGTAGAVGTFAFLGVTTGSGTTYAWTPDVVVPGSLLSWASVVAGTVYLGSTLGFGNWRSMGDLTIGSSQTGAGLFLRAS